MLRTCSVLLDLVGFGRVCPDLLLIVRIALTRVGIAFTFIISYMLFQEFVNLIRILCSRIGSSWIWYDFGQV